MKKILTTLLITLLLISCSEEETENVEKVKQDFFIETKSINEFTKSLELEKTGILSSSQDIKLNSQVSGRVGKIYVKEGEYVQKGDIIARLEDSIANYGLALERAQNSLDKASINYESTENQLNKQISDLEINLSNLKIDETNSKSSLELEKIENTIKKLALDYENLKISNNQSVEGFKNSMGKDLTSFITFVDDVIYFSDKILGVSISNIDENDLFEDYLGAKDSKQKTLSEDLLRNLIIYRNGELNNINFDFEGNNLFDANIDNISDGYNKISLLLTQLDITFDNSISSVGSLSETDISTYKGSITGYWSVYNLNNSTFISFKNTVTSFLDTYRNTEESLLKQIELLESDRKIYVKGLDVKLEIDESTLIEALSNKNLTLRQLNTSIVDARINYKQALRNVDKLAIKSPITGTIGGISIDVGQEVGTGTPLFNISNTSTNEVMISFSKDELNNINTGDLAYINFDDTVFTGSIYSISNIADSNLNYVGRISFDEGMNIIGDVVTVTIPFNINKNVLPLNIIKVDNLGNGIVNIFNSGSIEKQSLKIGNIYSDKIEILDIVNPDLDIIITDIDNFDNVKFNLKLK